MPTIDLNGLTLRYDDLGDPTGRPLILLHGLPGDASSWAPVLDGLSDHRLLVLDQRGQGGSSRPGGYTFEAMRDDVRDFAAALGLTDIVLIGHSMGGTVSALVAARYPDLVGQLVLVDSPVPTEPVHYQPPAETPANCDRQVFVTVFAQLADPDPAWWAELDSVTAQTLIVGGGSTSPVRAEQLAAMVDRLPDAQLVVIEGAGHKVHATRPAEFLNAVLPFVRSH